MNSRLLKELGINSLVGLVVFAWVFGQTPLTDRKPVSRPKMTALPKADKLGNVIPSVATAKLNQVVITTRPAALQVSAYSMDQQSTSQEAVATNLKVRKETTVPANLIGVYPSGSKFERIGMHGTWLHVRHIEDGASGWIHRDYLRAADGS